MLAQVASISLLVIAVLMGAGGLMGFVKGKSKASLIAGSISAVLYVVAFVLGMNSAQLGLTIGLVVTILLCVVFAIRLKKTGTFMPSGMLLSICIAEALLLSAAVFTH